MNKKTRLYEDYKLKQKRERERVKDVMDNTDKEIEILKKYLDDEDKFILEDRNREKGITDDLLKKVDEEYVKLNKEIIEPIKEDIKAKKDIVEEDQKLEEKGVQDVDLDDVLDEDDGVKQGLKITYNNVFDLEKELPIRIKLDVFFEDKLVFDEFGNPCLYDTPIIDDHVPKLVLTTKKKRKPAKIDVAVDEVQYVLKHFPGYIEIFKKTKNLYLRFIIEEVVTE